mgnify:CR=1 FL=1
MFVDTPGFQTRHDAALNRDRSTAPSPSTLADVDVVLFVVEAGPLRHGRRDRAGAADAAASRRFLIANKLDDRRPPRRPRALAAADAGAATPSPSSCRSRRPRRPTSSGCSASSSPTCPSSTGCYAEDALTDRSDRFLAAEIVREKLFRLTGDELPYTSTVVIDKYEERGRLRRIAATIVVERDAAQGDDHRQPAASG